MNGQRYILVVDYRSRFPEVISLHSTTTSVVINTIKSVFACHEIPRLEHGDNSFQFSAKEFAFADSYIVCPATSSLHFLQSSGEVERMIKDSQEPAADGR